MSLMRKAVVKGAELLLRSLNISLSELDRWIDLSSLGQTSSAGVRVSGGTAIRHPAVWACVRLVSEDLGHLPLHVFRRLAPGKVVDPSHSLYDVLHDVANPEMDAMVFRETMQQQVMLWGNAYAEIQYNNGGDIIALWPLRPDRTKPVRLLNGELGYEVRFREGSGITPQILPKERVFHLAGLGFDGIKGYTVFELFSQTIGLGLAQEEFAARFYGNGTHFGGFLQSPNAMSDKVYKRLQEQISNEHGGLSNAHRYKILEDGVTYKEVGMNLADAQFIDSRKFSNTDIAKLFRVPPHKIGELDRATFNNIEELNIDYVVGNTTPWSVRWEKSVHRQLMTREERRQYFVKHNLEGLLRGNTESRSKFFTAMFGVGAYSINMILEREDENPIGPAGDVHYVPLNMIPADQAMKGLQDDKPDKDPDDERSRRALLITKRLASAHGRVIADAAGRVSRRERNDLTASARKHLGNGGEVADFERALREFYKELPGWMERQMTAPMLALAEAVRAGVSDIISAQTVELVGLSDNLVRGHVRDFCTRYCDQSLNELSGLLVGDGALAAIEERLNEWEQNRPTSVSAAEATALSTTILRAVFRTAGLGIN